jgi:predicted enzyme related to lactoylglutathione lyase
MEPRPSTIIHPVKDLESAKKVYGALLGAAPTSDAPYYVGWDVAEHHIGLDPNGHSRGLTAPVTYWHVDDLDARLQQLLDAGAHEHQPVQQVGPGRRIASVTDADGNVLGLLEDA